MAGFSARIRGSLWKNSQKRKGYGAARGSYFTTNGDREFVLTVEKTGKTHPYPSPQAAIRDGWYIASPAK